MAEKRSRAPRTHVEDPLLGPLTDDWLTREVRVLQRARGHRFSSDDMATAFVAAQALPRAWSVLDLGCGLGSVLLHLAWTMPTARLVGIEAQAESFELVRRNVERNGMGDRVSLVRGDLREPGALAGLVPVSGFELVTGTPPYFPPGSAVGARDSQRVQARIEFRGGVEAYLEAGARVLAPDGALVICGDAQAGPRVLGAAQGLGLHLRARCDTFPQEGRPPLFSVWTLGKEPAALATTSLTLRTASGGRTPDADRLRSFSGW